MLVSHMFQNLLIYSPPSFIAFKFLNAIDPSFNKYISFSVVIFVHRLTNTQNYLEIQTNKQLVSLLCPEANTWQPPYDSTE